MPWWSRWEGREGQSWPCLSMGSCSQFVPREKLALESWIVKPVKAHQVFSLTHSSPWKLFSNLCLVFCHKNWLCCSLCVINKLWKSKQNVCNFVRETAHAECLKISLCYDLACYWELTLQLLFPWLKISWLFNVVSWYLCTVVANTAGVESITVPLCDAYKNKVLLRNLFLILRWRCTC